MMSIRDRRDATVEAEAQLREEDINHHQKINTIEKIDRQKEIGINQMKIRTISSITVPELTTIVNE
jgi:hypothetical protein